VPDSVTLIPHVAEKEHVFVPSEAWEMVTVLVYSVFVWLPDSEAVKLKLYFVPLIVSDPLLLAVLFMV
jgi:hypothetical protein